MSERTWGKVPLYFIPSRDFTPRTFTVPSNVHYFVKFLLFGCALGFSIAEPSARTGGRLSKSRISNYEQGIRRLGLEKAQILAKAHGTVSAVNLLCLDDEEFLTNQERNLPRRFRRTDEKGRERILAMAESQPQPTQMRH